MARNGSRRRGGHAEEHAANHERWLITYADLITLLMIFFVLMYTMSMVDAKKFEAVANALSQVLAGRSTSILDSSGPSAVEGRSGQIAREGPGTVPTLQGDMESIEKQLEQYIKSEPGLKDNIVLMEQERGLVISLKDTLLFAPGSDVLTPRAEEIVRQVGESLKTVPNFIRVEGHTDDTPIHTARFPSNWELSVMRATNVVKVLNRDIGIPSEKLSATGYGEYRPLVPNRSAAQRAINRRVDIVIMKQQYDYFEPASAGRP